jgi:hypothetical protein
MELDTHSTEGRAGLRGAQGIVQKRKTFVRAKSRIPNRPAHRSVTAAITLYRLVVTFHSYVRTFVQIHQICYQVFILLLLLSHPLSQNVTMSTGNPTRPAALQAWRWVKSSNTTMKI